MKPKTIALLHPGNMGATIGAAARAGGARVIWTSPGRTDATRERAERAGLIDVGNLPAALAQSEVVLSICPPHAALSVAHEVAKTKFQGIYVDANAVSRSTAEEIGRIVSQAGASFIDGGIIGSPVKQAGTTRLYLSGDGAGSAGSPFNH